MDLGTKDFDTAVILIKTGARKYNSELTGRRIRATSIQKFKIVPKPVAKFARLWHFHTGLKNYVEMFFECITVQILRMSSWHEKFSLHVLSLRSLSQIKSNLTYRLKKQLKYLSLTT